MASINLITALKLIRYNTDPEVAAIVQATIDELDRLQKLERQIEAGEMMSNWVSVKDRLPAPEEVVLRYGFDVLQEECWDVGELVSKDGHRWADWGVTHWMRLPAPPSPAPDNADWQMQNAMVKVK